MTYVFGYLDLYLRSCQQTQLLILFPISRTGFLNLGTVDILDQFIVSREVLSFASLASTYQVLAPAPQLSQPKMSSDLASGAKLPLIESHDSKVNRLFQDSPSIFPTIGHVLSLSEAS